jgi:glutamate-ammonia-ligase adenylyltransferase
LATSRFAANLLNRSPANVAILIGHGEAHGTGKADLRAELAASIERGAQLEQRGQLIRSMRNRELLRVAMAEVIDHLPVDQVGQQLSDLWDVVVNTALVVAEQALPGPVSLAIIALGRWGGRELTYGSDADLMVVTSESDDPDLQRLGEERLSLMRRLLQSSSVDPGLELDLGLRPEGKKGPMLRSLKSTLAYYQRWAQPWEAQALLRARFGGGDRGLADQFLSQINWFRYPAQGLDATAASSIRRLKARMETERIGRGVDPRNHVKLGPGGLSDVEWTVQMLQLQHGHQLAGLRVTGTLAALEAAQDAGLINQVEATRLRAAFEMASRIRNGNNLLAHRDANLIPANAQDLGHLAQALGYPRGQGSTLADDWHRTARLAKGVTDRVFWASQ